MFNVNWVWWLFLPNSYDKECFNILLISVITLVVFSTIDLKEEDVANDSQLKNDQIEQAELQQDKQLEKIQLEKESVEQELDIQIQENRRLSRLTLEQTEQIEELKTHFTRLQSESVDKSSLLNQIQSDKETVSRALQQNKILKEQLVELEEGFVKMVIV